MRSLQAYFKGWQTLLAHKRMWLLIYLTNFILALSAALPIPEFLGNTVGHSLSLDRSVEDFDFIFINEMMNEYGDLIRSILNQSVWYVVLFLVVSVFLMGGILQVFKNDEDRFQLSVFLKGSSRYFWRLFRLTIYFLIIHLATFVLFFSIYSAMCDGLNPFKMEGDRQMIDAFIILAPIYLLVFTIITLIHDYAKIKVVHWEKSLIFKPFWESFLLVFRNFGRFFLLYFMNIITFLICLGLYWIVGGWLDVSTMLGVFLLFIWSQLFVFARVGIRLLNLSSATFLYKWTRPTYNV